MSRGFRLVSLCLLAAVSVCAHGRADSTHPPPDRSTLDLPAYLARLDDCSAAASRLQTHPGEAAALKDSLPETWAVAVDGQRFEVSAGWLRQNLDAFPSDPAQFAERSRQILTRLELMRTNAEAWAEMDQGGLSGTDSTAARRRLDTILERREFGGRAARSPLQTWWDRAVAWVEEKLDSIFGIMGHRSGGPSPIFWVLAIALGLGMLGWLAQSILSVSRRPARGPLPRAPDIGGWRAWAARALACASRSEFREAIHLAYRAALYRLEEAGLWQVDEARTPREYLHLVPGAHGQYPALEALTFRFERSWYGGQAASAADFERVIAELEDLGCHFDWNPATASS
jgi:hypothetical protein